MNKEFLDSADKLLDVLSKAHFNVSSKELLAYGQIITKFCKLLDEAKKPIEIKPVENKVGSNRSKGH